MSRKLRIALAQTYPVSAPDSVQAGADALEPLKHNLRTVVRWTQEAKKGGAEVVVFPEYFLQGLVEGKEHMALPAKHALAVLQSLARDHDICICGTIVEPRSTDKHPLPTAPEPEQSPFEGLSRGVEADKAVTQAWNDYLVKAFPHIAASPSTPAEAHRHAEDKDLPESSPAKDRILDVANTAYFIEAVTGNIIGRYEKKNLWIPEREYLVAGDNSHEVFDTKWGKAGLLICWDLSRSVAAADLAKQGVDIIFAPTYWTGTDSEPQINPHSPPANYERDLLRTLAYARAFETETTVIMLNAGGPASEGFIGGSGCWMPFKGLVGEVAEQEGMTLVDVDLDVLKESRETYQIRADHKKRVGSL